jgi:nucleoside-diphosphate-sugar epimerase
MRTKNILIIGGTSFFGKSIIEYLLKKKIKKKIKLIIFSRSAKKLKINNRINNKLIIQKINGDILRVKFLPKADLILYCALLKNLKKDLSAVDNFCSIAKEIYKKSKILYTSSGAVYGVLPKSIKKVKENYNKFKKFKSSNYKNKYSLAKIANEQKFQELGRLGLRVSVARCFSFVGEHLVHNSKYAISDFINSVLKNEPIKIKSNFKVARSYLDADCLSKFLFKILNKANIHCPIYNCGSDNLIYLDKLAQLLSLRYNLKFNQPKFLKNYVDHYIPNINKFRNEFKYYKKLNSYNSVIHTIENIKKKNNYFL